MMALLKAQQINKSDRNDARGIAQMMRVGLFKPVHVKTQMAQEQRMLLTSRKLLQRKLLDVESDLRGTLRNFGLKVGVVNTGKFEARYCELVAGSPRLALVVQPALAVRRVMRQQFAVLHKMLLDTVRHDPICRRLMTCPFSKPHPRLWIGTEAVLEVEGNPIAQAKPEHAIRRAMCLLRPGCGLSIPLRPGRSVFKPRSKASSFRSASSARQHPSRPNSTRRQDHHTVSPHMQRTALDQ